MKNSKLYYLFITLIFLGSCTSDTELEDETTVIGENLVVVAARGVSCDNALNGPSSVQANTARSYTVVPVSPTTNPSSIQWSTSTSTMTIVSGQGTTNVSVFFSSAFTGGNLTVSINGGVCQTIKYISRNGICTDDCGETFGGSYGVTSSYHIYPAESFDVSCVLNGSNLRMFVSPATVPNRFTIKNSSGSVVADSGWIGTANYPGPWGFFLSSGATNLNFTKTSNTYTLIVETATPPNQTDSWSASLSCQ